MDFDFALSGADCIYNIYVFQLCHKNIFFVKLKGVNTVELQWLVLLWDYENILETWVARANEC